MAWHYLRTNESSWRPQNVLCVDTETVSVSHSQDRRTRREVFRLGVAKLFRLRRNRYHAARTILFTDREVFWKAVEKATKPNSLLWVFAHNVGFDSRVLGFWQLLDCGRFVRVRKRDRSKGSHSGLRQSEFATGLLITSDPPTVVECWSGNGGKIRMVDTLNYWPVSLAEIGEWVGIPKLPMPDPWSPDEDWFRYCERDVDILVAAITKYINWVNEQGLGVFSITLPSQAMHGYRHTMAARSIVIHDNLEVQKLEGESYYGGEIWCGKIGWAGREDHNLQRLLDDSPLPEIEPESYRVHALDSNSLFPAVMGANRFPRRLLSWRTSGDGSRSLVSEMGDDCIAECLLHADTDGVYTRRLSRSGRFTGPLVAVIAGPELESYLSRGLVIAVRRYARYELADLFSAWVERWWLLRFAAKLAGDTFADQLCKRILNSLYGKWAQKRYEWEDEPEATAPDPWATWTELDTTNHTITHYRSIAGTVQRAVEKGYHHHAFVAISSFIAAYAREHMRRFRTIAGAHQTYYQGVDSLFVSDLGLRRLRDHGCIDRARLGLLRHEASAETAYFAGWGLYKFGQRWTRTAVGRGAIECEPGEFEQTNFERLAASLTHTPTDGVETSVCRKVIGAANPIGVVNQDGWVSAMPAKWGDNPAETTDSRGFYYDHLRDRHDEVTTVNPSLPSP